jgi:glycerol-3-phosphate acyltransferase PlsX
MRIILDAMGTDHAPRSEVAGALEALQVLDSDVEIVLVGDREIIEAELAKYDAVPDRLSIHHASDRVTPDDSPASVIRRKPESSIVVGLRLHKDGAADGFVSAGSTGAIMATSHFALRPLPGVDRPTVATTLPTSQLPVLLLDAGANVDCKPHHLVQFAHLGNIYAQDMMGRSEPKIALLNIGEEPGKGDELSATTHRLLCHEAGLNFVGNVEGRDITTGVCDVVVCDGFVGNVLLKFYESISDFFMGLLSDEGARAGGSPIVDRMLGALKYWDYAETGGAPLLGVGGVSLICHGESPPKAISNALRQAVRAVRSNMVEHSAQELSRALEESSREAS